MSLKAIQHQFPGEVLPSHYEVRSLNYPSYRDNYFRDNQVGEGDPTTIVHGKHDNLLNALRQQAEVEITRSNAQHGHPTPALGNDVLDLYASALKPSVGGRHPSAPYVAAVYPDGSMINVDQPNLAMNSEGHYLNHAHEDFANTNIHSNAALGSKHAKLIHELVKHARDLWLAKPDNAEAKALREQALRQHDLTPLLLAADAMEEHHPNHKEDADKIRESIRKSELTSYKTSEKVIKYYYAALKQLFTVRDKVSDIN